MITSRQASLTCHVLISEQSATAGVRGDLEQSGAVIVDAAGYHGCGCIVHAV